MEATSAANGFVRLTQEQAKRAAPIPGCRPKCKGSDLWWVPVDLREWLDLPPLASTTKSEVRRFYGMTRLQHSTAALIADRRGGIVAFEPGAGKSVVGLAVAVRPGAGPCLILGPAMSRNTWRREVGRWLQQDLAICGGLTPNPDRVNNADGPVFLNYEVAHAWADCFERRGGGRFDTVILDEIHRVKRRRGVPARATADILRWQRRALRVGLTATPVWNHLDDLWSVLEFIHRGQYGRRTRFAARYRSGVRGKYGTIFGAPSHVEELRHRVKYVVFEARSPKARADLPTRPSADRSVEWVTDDRLAKKSLDLYIQGEVAKGLAVASDVRVEHAATLAKPGWMLGTRTIRAAKHLAKLVADRGLPSVTVVTGSVPAERRLELVAKVAHEGGVLVCTQQSMLESVDCSALTGLVVVDLPWTPHELLQFEGRLRRPGAVRASVPIVYILMRSAADEVVAHALSTKIEEHQSVLAPDDNLQGLGHALQEAPAEDWLFP